MGAEKRFGLLGRKLGHSYSPMIHALLADYPYALYEVEPEDLPAFMADTALSGFNVTIPYKEAVLPYLQALSPAALRIGSVNTVLRAPDGGLQGDNTDYAGFAHLVSALHVPVRGLHAVVLGSGGSSKTVQAVLRDLGADRVSVVSRQGEQTYANLARLSDAELVVNTTPVGMYPRTGAAPADIALFPKLQGVLDLIYNPGRTRLLMAAEARGVPALNGLPMLVAQAAHASAAFTGTPAAKGRIEEITQKIARVRGNVVLLGMPGCGKTSIGRALAAQTGRPFRDADGEITRRIAMPIPAFFAAHGEDAFRRIETETLDVLCRESGLVIAAGGGAVTRPENRGILRQNGTAVYIRRALTELATGGRPLSLRHGVETLYETRRPLYEAFAEVAVDNVGVEETAREIARRLNLCAL